LHCAEFIEHSLSFFFWHSSRGWDGFGVRVLELAVQFNPDRCDQQARDAPEGIEHEA
jgi:hypothetical protein